MGPGVFIKSLLKTGVNSNQITAFDIDNSYEEEIQSLGVKFEQKDTLLSITPEFHNEYDFIIGNPPYLNKASLYVKNHRNELKRIYGKINSHETYSMFIINAIWRLKEGGKLGFITSDSFLTLRTHERLRQYILQNCLVNELFLAPEDLFNQQNVSTKPVIIILTKCTGRERDKIRNGNVMRVISRIESEADYNKPDKKFEINQEKYSKFPFNIFFVDVEDAIIELFEKSNKINEVMKGFIGMHTHDNKKFIAAIAGTEMAEIFRKRNQKLNKNGEMLKVISKYEIESGLWKPYLKRGGADQYFRPIMEAVKWDEESVKIYDIPQKVPFEQEGIVISGVSSRLAARYMPRGCYWDSNKAIGFILKNESISIHYILGLLNSSLYNYLAKGIINNTSSIQISGINSLPFIYPEPRLMKDVDQMVAKIIKLKKNNSDFNYTEEQREIDNAIFNFYSQKFNFSNDLKRKIDKEYSNYR